MKFNLLYFIILLNSYIVLGQQQYFNKRFDFNSPYENGFDILRYDSGYIAWFEVTLDPMIYEHQVIVAFIDSIGDTIRTKIINRPNKSLYVGNPGGICQNKNGGFSLAGSIADSLGNLNVILYNFDNGGDTLWTLEYGDTSFQSGWQCKRTRDNGFVIVGQTESYDYNGDILLLKIDSSGVVKWEKHFGGSDEDLAYSVDTCTDGGYIIAGRTRSFGVHPNTAFENAYIVKTDSAGSFEWQKVFGEYLNDEFRFVCSGIDGYIYAFGSFGFSGDSIICCTQYNKPFIVKIDLLGNIQWEKFYGDSMYDLNITSAELIPDGNFVAAGLTFDTTCYKALFLKINSNGDSLLYRTYRGLQGLYSHSFFYDVSNDKDNGFICTGWVGPDLPDTGHQDIWVLKLDSNGCEIANCFFNSTEDVSASSTGFISIYPNPVYTQAVIELSLSEEKSCTVKINDFLGRTVKEFYLDDSRSKIIFDAGYLSTGIYLVSVFSEKGWLCSTRLLKAN